MLSRVPALVETAEQTQDKIKTNQKKVGVGTPEARALEAKVNTVTGVVLSEADYFDQVRIPDFSIMLRNYLKLSVRIWIYKCSLCYIVTHRLCCIWIIFPTMSGPRWLSQTNDDNVRSSRGTVSGIRPKYLSQLNTRSYYLPWRLLNSLLQSFLPHSYYLNTNKWVQFQTNRTTTWSDHVYIIYWRLGYNRLKFILKCAAELFKVRCAFWGLFSSSLLSHENTSLHLVNLVFPSLTQLYFQPGIYYCSDSTNVIMTDEISLYNLTAYPRLNVLQLLSKVTFHWLE